MTMVNDSARSVLASWLSTYGLASLADWAYGKLTAGASIDQIMLDLTNTPEYQARFPAMAELRATGRGISEQQYKAYEDAVRQMMRNSGLPAGFYDQPSDFAQLFTNNVSIAEVESRVIRAYEQVAFAPDDVKNAFAQMYGPGSNDGLAAFMLDPEKARPMIERQVAAAQVAAQGQRVGLTIDKPLAEQLATALPGGDAQRAVAQAGQLRPLTEQTVLEQAAGTGVTTEQLLKETGGLSPQTTVKSALQSRVAQFQGAGGAVQSQEGVIGLGGSQQ